MIVRARILLLNIVAFLGAVAALLPLVARRRPLGYRTQVPHRVARVIPLEQRRRASPP
jgi:hypothetical protein